jgi:hypothetical protein
MKFSFIASLALAAALTAAPAAAQAPQGHGGGKAAVTEVAKALLVGTVTVEPGTYRFECKHLDGRDYLVVSIVESKEEVAKVPCTPINLERKVQYTELRTMKRPDGALVLTQVRIAGETIAHGVALPPTTE